MEFNPPFANLLTLKKLVIFIGINPKFVRDTSLISPLYTKCFMQVKRKKEVIYHLTKRLKICNYLRLS